MVDSIDFVLRTPKLFRSTYSFGVRKTKSMLSTGSPSDEWLAERYCLPCRYAATVAEVALVCSYRPLSSRVYVTRVESSTAPKRSSV